MRKVSGNIKCNLSRIHSKIINEGSCYKVKDMIRATLVARNAKDLKEIYLHLKEMNLIKIVKIENNLKNTGQNIIINFIWKDNNEYYNEEAGLE